MNILTAKYKGTEKELIDNFPNELDLLRQMIGELSDSEQLDKVRHYITQEGDSEIKEIIDVHNEEIEKDEHKIEISRFRFMLLEIQFSLGEPVKEVRGAGSSNQL